MKKGWPKEILRLERMDFFQHLPCLGGSWPLHHYQQEVCLCFLLNIRHYRLESELDMDKIMDFSQNRNDGRGISGTNPLTSAS